MYTTAVVFYHVPPKQEKICQILRIPKLCTNILHKLCRNLHCLCKYTAQALWSTSNSLKASKFIFPKLVYFFTCTCLVVFEITLTATQQTIIITVLIRMV